MNPTAPADDFITPAKRRRLRRNKRRPFERQQKHLRHMINNNNNNNNQKKKEQQQQQQQHARWPLLLGDQDAERSILVGGQDAGRSLLVGGPHTIALEAIDLPPASSIACSSVPTIVSIDNATADISCAAVQTAAVVSTIIATDAAHLAIVNGAGPYATVSDAQTTAAVADVPRQLTVPTAPTGPPAHLPNSPCSSPTTAPSHSLLVCPDVPCPQDSKVSASDSPSKKRQPVENLNAPLQHPNFIYFHYMNAHYKPMLTKKDLDFISPFKSLDLLESSTQLPIPSELWYGAKGLGQRPHGSYPVASYDAYIASLGSATKSPFCPKPILIDSVSPSDIFATRGDWFVSAFPGSEILKPMEEFIKEREEWLELVLNEGQDSPVRNSNKGNSVAKRITLGFSQKQKAGLPHTHFEPVTNLKMPYFSFPHMGPSKRNVPRNLCLELGQLLGYCQFLLDRNFPEDKELEDLERTRLFGSKFCQTFNPTSTGRFEFVDIFVESGSGLNRHLDWKNDKRAGYSACSSYSYLITRPKDGRIYRVNFIMTYRTVCGAFMKEYHTA